MRRILVVDDDPHICLANRTRLQRYGLRVSIADGGFNDLAALDNATFDLMVVDIFMPNMRGFESIRMFYERAPAVPLIAISGFHRRVPVGGRAASKACRHAGCHSERAYGISRQIEAVERAHARRRVAV
jgi:DNA-binding NtrC family response regulator